MGTWTDLGQPASAPATSAGGIDDGGDITSSKPGTAEDGVRWTSECDGSGTVPAVSDVVDSEDWAA